MNTICISNNLDWNRIVHLMKVGLLASVIATIGDLLLGWGVYDDSTGGITRFFSLYQTIPDGRLLASSLLGMVGMCLEILCLFAVYRPMADKAESCAHAYRAGILGSAIFGVCGYHVAFVAMFFSYKKVCEMGGAEKAAEFILQYAGYFVLPAVALFLIFFLALTVTQIKVFVKGYTPYPKWCWVFSVLPMAVIVSGICEQVGNYPLANAIGTAWLHIGFLWMYSGLLIVGRKGRWDF